MGKASRILHLLLLAGLLSTNLVPFASAQTGVISRIVLDYGGTLAQRKRIGAALSAVLHEINRIAAGRGNFELVRIYEQTQILVIL